MSRPGSLNPVELESRFVAHAGLVSAAITDSMDDGGHDPGPPTRPTDAIAGIDAERRGGQILLTVRVADWCPQCSLRLSGVTRQVGDGTDRALFLVPSGARRLMVEMTDETGRFVPVLHVNLGPDGRVEHQPAASDAGEMIVHPESEMPMPMGEHADMASHPEAASTDSSRPMTHTSMSEGQSLAAMPGHGVAMVHRAMDQHVYGSPNGHTSMDSMPAAATATDAHAKSDADPFDDAAGAEGAPLDDNHGAAMAPKAVPAASEGGGVVDDEGELPPRIVDPLIAVAEPSGDKRQSFTEPDELNWQFGAGGTFLSAALFTASKAIERRAGRKLATSQPCASSRCRMPETISDPV